jgi:hypothetical protein
MMLPTANPSVIFKVVADGAVLFAPGQEIYFGLNDVGARVWQLLPPASASLDELCAHLAAQYPDVPPETIRADVRELLDDLMKQGLVTPPSGAADAAAPDAARAP